MTEESSGASLFVFIAKRQILSLQVGTIWVDRLEEPSYSVGFGELLA